MVTPVPTMVQTPATTAMMPAMSNFPSPPVPDPADPAGVEFVSPESGLSVGFAFDEPPVDPVAAAVGYVTGYTMLCDSTS